MKIFAPKETAEGEKRVAATPDVAKRAAGLGLQFLVEHDAGAAAALPDGAYKDADAEIVDAAVGWGTADVVACVRPPDPQLVGQMRKDAILVGLIEPHGDAARIQAYAQAGVAAFAFEFVPRISRAQGMDALSSQANLAGYAAVILAAGRFARAFPMMVTAAGTVAPARVLVLGAGVAGLQAIATARRLGAIVSAMDVREAAREQVESLGATFVSIETEEKGEGAGGYAREMSEDYRRRQASKLRDTLERSDIVVTTALVPGRPAPRLIDRTLLGAMKPGSIVVDLAAAAGGNVEGSVAGEAIEVDGVQLLGEANMPSAVAQDASNLYARNVLNFLTPLIDADTKSLAIDWDDEVVKGALVTRGGAVVHPQLQPQEDSE